MSITDESETLDLSDVNTGDVDGENSEFPTIAVLVTAVSAFVCLISGLIWYLAGDPFSAIVCLISQTVLVSIVIWQACDPFADAAEHIGHVLKLPGSVRGATLDAIASSMPELFTGIIFVILAVLYGREGVDLQEASGEGFALVIATCAGSAVYNMILIPAICAIFISYYRPSRPTIDVEYRVIVRDGAWFVLMEILLIVFLLQQRIEWWMGVVFLLGYAAYVTVLYFDARRFQKQVSLIEGWIAGGMSGPEALSAYAESGKKVSRDLRRRFETVSSSSKNEVLGAMKGEIGEKDSVGPEGTQEADEEPDTAEVCFGIFPIRLNLLTSWLIIAIATVFAATACYWLVEITQVTAEKLHVPVFFVAVILAAAASSVPDTFLSVGSAKRGDDDGAVSNAFGSNIFDISICISIPLLVASYLNNWEPIVFAESASIVSLQVMLAILTVITLSVIAHKLQLTRRKAYFLVSLYVVFIVYAVVGSLGTFG